MLLFEGLSEASAPIIRVATVREKSGKNQKILRLAKSQGIFLKSEGKSLILAKSVKSQGIPFSGVFLISFVHDFLIHFLLKTTKEI